MATTNLGRITIVPKGTWASGTYKALDLVRYNGSAYLAKIATSTVPTTTTDWTLIVTDGATGATGSTGATGATLYTWVKYADDASGTNLSDTSTGKSYIGIAVNQASSTKSTTPGDYTWTLIKGLDGSGTPSSTAPVMDGTATVGVATSWARGDHVHPSDTTKASLSANTFTGVQTFVGIKETSVNVSASNIDLSLGTNFYKTISSATTFTLSNVAATGLAPSFVLELTNGGSSSVTWWSGVKWTSGTAPTLTTSGVDILGFYTRDGGTTWRGFVLSKDNK